MKLPKMRHKWRLTPRKAIQIQRELASRVELIDVSGPAPRWMAGLDAAFTNGGKRCIGGIVVWDLKTRQVVERQVAIRPVVFPYIPGLLSFREAPALLACLRKLHCFPDVLMCDGQGTAHPRRFGIACHLGVLSNLPSFGCAKSILIGEHQPLGQGKGSVVDLVDKGEIIGKVVRTQSGMRPVIISVGHKLSLQTCVEMALVSVSKKYRIPEPTRLADKLVTDSKSS